MIGCLSWYSVFALGACGQPHVITKLMMTRSVEDNRHMLPISVVGYGITALLWIGIGLSMRALVLQGAHAELANADDAASVFLQHYAHPLLSGMVFAGLLAAIMSTRSVPGARPTTATTLSQKEWSSCTRFSVAPSSWRRSSSQAL